MLGCLHEIIPLLRVETGGCQKSLDNSSCVSESHIALPHISLLAKSGLSKPTAKDQQPTTAPQIPPSKMHFDKYRSAESGITVTTLFPELRLSATCKAANSAPPPLEPEKTPYFPASMFTLLNSSFAFTIIISSQTQ